MIAILTFSPRIAFKKWIVTRSCSRLASMSSNAKSASGLIPIGTETASAFQYSRQFKNDTHYECGKIVAALSATRSRPLKIALVELRHGRADVIHQPMVDVTEHLAGWRGPSFVVDPCTNLHSRRVDQSTCRSDITDFASSRVR